MIAITTITIIVIIIYFFRHSSRRGSNIGVPSSPRFEINALSSEFKLTVLPKHNSERFQISTQSKANPITKELCNWQVYNICTYKLCNWQVYNICTYKLCNWQVNNICTYEESAEFWNAMVRDGYQIRRENRKKLVQLIFMCFSHYITAQGFSLCIFQGSSKFCRKSQLEIPQVFIKSSMSERKIKTSFAEPSIVIIAEIRFKW